MFWTAYRPAKIQDVRQFLGVLTPRRCANALLVYFSYLISRLIHRPVHFGMPITVSIEPTTSCNLRCPECPSGLRSFTRPTGMLDAAEFQTWIDQFKHSALYLILYFQGEPFIHPQFFSLIQKARQAGLYTITSTNAHFLDDARARKVIESGLSRLILSIDGATQEVYQQYRVGGRLDTVLSGVHRLVKWKKALNASHPYLVVQFLVFRPNEGQIEEMREWASHVGVDEFQLKTAQLYEYQNGNPLMPRSEHLSRYQKLPDGTYRLRHKLLNHCWRLWHTSVITWDGRVLPCCFDKDARHQLGSLRIHPFRAIWQGALMARFRQKLLRGRAEIDICTNCTEGCRVNPAKMS
jgi:MoaA/NifB/PqqE/SkfB family radical SAM enzyme